MSFAGMSYVAIPLAAVASWLFGALWYGVLFSARWLDALGKTKEDLVGPSGKPSPLPFILSFLAQLLMAWVLAGLIGHMGAVTIRSGIISALFLWAGFVITTLTTNHAFQGSKPALTVIDGGHWLGVLVIQGLVIGLIGIR